MAAYKYPCCDCNEEYDASVQCEKCPEWYHFECVGVDESVAEVIWFCSTCIGEDRSIRESLGAPGRTRIHPVVINHPPADDAGSGSCEGTGKEVGKVASKDKSTERRISRALAQDDGFGNKQSNQGNQEQESSVEDRREDVAADKAEDHANLMNEILQLLNRHHSLVGDSLPPHVDSNKPNASGKSGLRKSVSVPSEKSISTRSRALKELRELEEKNQLDELEEENQLKILELQRKRIARRKEALERRMQLRKIINEDAEDESDSVAEDVDESMDQSGTQQPEKQPPKNLGVIPKVPRKRTAEDDFQEMCDRFKKLLGERLGGKPAKQVPKKPTRKPSSKPRLPRPSFEKDDDALQSILDGGASDDDAVVGEGPTRLQIASRQVFPRSLPKFYGAAEEWPIFISAYEQANLSCGFTNAENLVRLQDALKGKALETVRNRLLLPENVPLIIEKLRKRFGNPEILSTRLATKIQQLEGPSSESLESVIEFGSAVEEFTQHLKAAGLVDHLKNPILMQSLVQKLPSYYAMEWVDYKRRAKTVDLETFGAFMESLVEKALEATFEKAELDGKAKRKQKSKVKAFVHATDEGSQDDQQNQKEPKKKTEQSSSNQQQQRSPSQPQPREMKCSVCRKPGHFGRNCQEFAKQSLEERWKTVKRLNLCPLCLYDHGQRSCRIRMTCKVEGCHEYHNALLHSGSGEGSPRVRAQCNSHRQQERAVLFRMAPVTLYNGKKRVNALALIDEGSSITIVDSELVESLGADGPVEPLQMCWTNGVQRTENRSKKVTLEISARGSPYRYDLMEARTVQKLDLPAQQMDSQKLKEQFEHLQDISIPSYELAAPKVLIGIDNAHLIAPLDSRVGDSGEPVAVRCNLGWTVYGPRPNVLSRVNFLGHHRCACEECSMADKKLDEALKQHYQLEEVGTSAIRLESQEDRRAREILERTTKRVGARFETGLLWKDDDVRFPESFNMAMKRLRSLESRMDRNPGVRENLRKQLEDYLTKGYAHRITEQELAETPSEKVWYLPLNYVVNPKKPGKVRLVWDAAAKANGVSLNDMLLKGPDMVTALPDVINGFRERKVAFGGDIREMFHQANVRPEDRQAQRFVFLGPNGEIEIYVMDVVIFGASCSPSSAQFVKNLNAQEHAVQYPEVADAIVRKHYVDDYFDSADTDEEAVKRALDVRTVHANGGFEIRNWISNSEVVLRELGESKCAAKPLEVDKSCGTERVLGMLWDPEGDNFIFSTEIRQDLQPYIREGAWPTKRIALRCIASMFDPKQFLAPLLVHGRSIMQDLWRSGIGWDQKLTEAHYKRWVQWTQLFPLIDEIRVPRCYLGGLDSKAYETVQLHVFTDAGDAAYGCVAYFRFEYGGVVHCAFIEAKAKVAPLQYLSTPRMELEAAVLGARLTKKICESHSFPISKRFLWCDSDTVVSWVKSDQRRYKPFVAHRVGEILNITNPEDWRWVGTKDNPADDLTKWGKGTEIKSESRWYQGPEFLHKDVAEWPKQKRPAVELREELRASVLLHHILLPEGLMERMQHISRWTVMVRTVATMYRFVSNCRRRIMNMPIEALPMDAQRAGSGAFSAVEVPLRQEEYRAAETLLWRMVQAEEFADEVKTLVKNRDSSVAEAIPLEKSSLLYRLIAQRAGSGAFSAVEVPLWQEEYRAAETLLWRMVQAEEFADEVKTLVKNRDSSVAEAIPLEKSSLLYRLSPLLDEDGVVRMEGRTEAADYVAFDARFPIILPKDHIMTRRLLEHFHRQYGHSSRETVVNEVRQRFYIPCLRVLVDQVMRDCLWCKIRKAKPTVPRMAPLPEQRLAAKIDPFSNVGIDYFGPLEVTVGRRKEKRWVALFTCLTVRAVHLEVAYSLTTESCKMAIRRFVKRRGSPIEIFSDNGTNFVGANRDLLHEINVACADTFTGAKTRWTFNPPSAPHMGGAWERMVRSVKEALHVFTDGRKLTDEILQTALIEAENLVNSRPLTYVSTNVKEDKEALTPNHFLRGRSSAECLPSRIPVDLADTLRSSYSRAQQLADGFWDRSQREYLPTQNRRSKWYLDHRKVAIGDLVFVADGEKRNTWERGMVTQVFAGSDGRIRSASVQTSKGEKLRPVSKLAVLEIEVERSNPRTVPE